MEAREWLDSIAGLLGSIAWPVVVVIVLLVSRKSFIAILGAIRDRIADPEQQADLSVPGVTLGLRGRTRMDVSEVAAAIPSLPVNFEPSASLEPDQLLELQTEYKESQAQAARWHFSYLATALDPDAYHFLTWLAGNRSGVARGAAHNPLRRKSATDEAAIVAALELHDLIEEKAALLTITTRGRRFVSWVEVGKWYEGTDDSHYGPEPPFVAYGTGLRVGEEVVALVNGVIAGAVRADKAGAWMMQIGPRVNAVAGDSIEFLLDGEPAARTEVFSDGGTPRDRARGVIFRTST